MPRCFPPKPEFAEDRRGERATWEVLQATLPDDAALLYSVWIIEDQHEYEIDLLIAWPGVGLCAVEVKGGTVERDAEGQWWQVRGQNRRRAGHPLVQASDARHALHRFLARRGAQAARARTAHVLVLPHTDIAASYSPPDLPRSLVVDRVGLADAATLVRAAVERHGEGHAPLTEVALEELLAVLVERLPAQTSSLNQAEEHEQRVDQLTRDQARTLESFRHHARLAIIGGAGTGKTWLALEQARRLTESGQRVALLCYSRGLGRFLQRIAGTWRHGPAYVGLFHDLAVDWGAPPPSGEPSDYYERELPEALRRLAAEHPAADRFDAVIVDEAQDFGELWWPSLLACLREPASGGVFVFLDQGQRVFARTSEPPVDTAPYVLTENIRNTKRIAQVFGSLSPEQSTYRGMDGPAVRFVQTDSADVVSRADDAVEALCEDWSPGKVALLTTHHRHPVQGEVIDGRGWQAYWDDFFAEQDVFYGHVLGFKGLERQVVVLAVNGFKDTDRAKEMLYVGLSRARTQLVVVGDLAAIAAVGGEGVKRRLVAAEQWQP